MENFTVIENGYIHILDHPNRIDLIEAKIERLSNLLMNKYIEPSMKHDIQKDLSYWALKIGELIEN